MGDPLFWLILGGAPTFFGWQSYKHADGEILGYAAAVTFLVTAFLLSVIYLGNVVYRPDGESFDDLFTFIAVLAPLSFLVAVYLALTKEIGCLGAGFVFGGALGILVFMAWIVVFA